MSAVTINWETGGIRYKVAGEPGGLYYCPKCEKGRIA